HERLFAQVDRGGFQTLEQLETCLLALFLLFEAMLFVGFTHQRSQLADPRVGIRRDVPEYRLEFPDHPVDCLRSKQIAVVVERTVDAAEGFPDKQRQVKLGSAVASEHAERQPRKLKRLHRRVLKYYLYLKHRRVLQASLRIQRLDELLEGHFLICICAQRGLANTLEHFAKSRIA